MPKFELLCTTMHQMDFAKVQQMNIRCDAVLANQADRTEEMSKEFDNFQVRMITTATRGVSKNRNVAIEHIAPDTEIVMFTDDDLSFYDVLSELVLREFDIHPEADAIKFNLSCVSERKISMRSTQVFHKANRKEIGSWGVCGLAIKAELLRKRSLQFNERFGPGTANYCGEDTIFLQELLKKGVGLYASPVYVADIDQSVSSWFTGFDRRYFQTGGMVLQEIYPLLCYPLALRGAWRFSRRLDCSLSFWQILGSYLQGIGKNRRER